MVNISLAALLQDNSEEKLQTGTIYSVSGPVVVAEGIKSVAMYDLVRIGASRLQGEVIKIDKGKVTIQVFEDTCGLRVGDAVVGTAAPLSVELGPGLLGSIFDGIQRPLERMQAFNETFIPLGVSISALDRKRQWEFVPMIRVGERIIPGKQFGWIWDEGRQHPLLLPPDAPSGRVSYISVHGHYSVDECVVEVQEEREDLTLRIASYTMLQRWPVRKPRPVAEKIVPNTPLFTGQRVFDCLFPTLLGGTCAIPGAFGCGKTVVSQAIAKFSNSDAIVYVGCGERGNEMAEVLAEFPRMTIQSPTREDSSSVMSRTVLIANTSNMPVAAREASIYTGITIAEYFRDLGKNVSLLADSSSRWAEALREVSGRLGEIPADGGYPAYLSARLASFYERAGSVRCLGGDRHGSISVISAVSPPGGDFSDPVTAATLGIVQTFWGLDKQLAQRKHFPSLNWSISFAKASAAADCFYRDNLKIYNTEDLRRRCLLLLQRELELREILQLVGVGNLSREEKLELQVASLIREFFLQQNGYSATDRCCSVEKGFLILRGILDFFSLSITLLSKFEWVVLWEKLQPTFQMLQTLKDCDEFKIRQQLDGMQTFFKNLSL